MISHILLAFDYDNVFEMTLQIKIILSTVSRIFSHVHKFGFEVHNQLHVQKFKYWFRKNVNSQSETLYNAER